jgi:DNA modification methylase
MENARLADNEFLARYDAFLRAKITFDEGCGFEVDDSEINPVLKPHQRAAVRWAVRGGRRALFEQFGLGKTIQQLEILRLILAKLGGGRGLIICPLGVRQEFKRDALERLGWEWAPHFVRRSLDLDTWERQMLLDGKVFHGIYLTNYESVRDGKLDPNLFDVVSLDEAACLRGFGSSKLFREFMGLFAGDKKTLNTRERSVGIKYRFVATATPSPNEFIELLAYAAFLGIGDVSGNKTRFFKRDSTKADKLTLHPHKEKEFWLWLSTWALFLDKPSSLGFDDTGYALPPMTVIKHEVTVDHTKALAEKNGQRRMFRDSTHGVVEAAKEKRDTLPERLEAMKAILAASPDDHFLLWHDLEAERKVIEKAIPGAVSVYGSQDLDQREQAIINFSDGKIQYLAGKPSVAGTGCNFQYHCHKAVFLGIGFKFAEFIQAFHRIYRFLQSEPVEIHLIYAESERSVLKTLERKWSQHDEMVKKMSEIIQEYGLSIEAMTKELKRGFGVERVEVKGENYTAINYDSVLETRAMKTDSVHLILTSIPFSTQYEYSPNFADFGHSDNNEHFFQQMDFLTPELLRVLIPGRTAAIHVKDRIVPSGMTGLGQQIVYPFHAKCIEHYTRHGFAYMGMKTIVTDVVRENNQTYRLGWTEQCKDGTKMGVGMPEYLLLFRKPPTDTSNSYGDCPVVKSKPMVEGDNGQPAQWGGSHERRAIIQNSGYSRSRWQIDAHGFSRSAGDRLMSPDELKGLSHKQIFRMFREHSLEQVYDFEQHVRIGEELERLGKLPVTFMLLQPQSWHPDVWTDITRMLTLNGTQAAKGKEQHLCPMQFDLADRVIAQLSMPDETVLDPFGGLMTVPYRAIKLGRKVIGIELSTPYFLDGVFYCKAAEQDASMPSLFSVIEGEEVEADIEAAIA